LSQGKPHEEGQSSIPFIAFVTHITVVEHLYTHVMKHLYTHTMKH